MADRADYLARTLLARLGKLEKTLAEENRAVPDRRKRIEVIEKVLAVELGVTDSVTLAVVESAVPHLDADKPGSPRELTAFADFLRQRLAAHLA